MLRLAVSKEEAEKQIQAQISKGGQLRNDLMLSAEFMDTLNACVRWSKYYEFWQELQDRQLDSDAPKGKAVLGQSERDFPSSDDEQVIDSLLLLC